MKLSNGGTSALLLCLLTAPVVAVQLVFPEYRYKSFVTLSNEENTVATQLGYNSTTWNLPGSLLELEGEAYYYLTNTQKGFVQDIGFPTESGLESETWDCYVNHYYQYEWNEREAASAAWAVLGFNSATWDTQGSTDTTLKFWEDLTAAEQEAALNICYFEQTWDRLETPIPDWPDDIAKPEPSIGPSPPIEPEYPLYRYTAFSDLTDAVKTAVSQLGWDSTKWNLPGSLFGSGEIEENAYYYLTTAQKGFVQDIGFPNESDEKSETWDCYVNHFDDYEWDERGDATASWAALGYDSDTWLSDLLDEDEAPGALKVWADFNAAEKEAAENLCYIEQTWDEVSPIPDWPDEIKGTAAPSTAAPTVTPTTAPTVTPTAAPTTAAPTKPPTTAPPTTTAPSFTDTTAPSVTPPTAAPTTTAPSFTPTSAPSVTPTTAAPTTTAPSFTPTSAPSVTPTTAAPTTSAPTTSAPTTAAPTTAAPTVTPTTTAPTTAAPTTAAPTTAAPTTAAPTTAAPTTAAPTTAAPSGIPSFAPSFSSKPSRTPSFSPTSFPSSLPSFSAEPSSAPTSTPVPIAQVDVNKPSEDRNRNLLVVAECSVIGPLVANEMFEAVTVDVKDADCFLVTEVIATTLIDTPTACTFDCAAVIDRNSDCDINDDTASDALRSGAGAVQNLDLKDDKGNTVAQVGDVVISTNMPSSVPSFAPTLTPSNAPTSVRTSPSTSKKNAKSLKSKKNSKSPKDAKLTKVNKASKASKGVK